MVTVGKTCPILFVPEDDDRALGHNGVAHPAGCKLDGIVAAVNFRENIGNDAFFLEDAVHNGADEVSFFNGNKGLFSNLIEVNAARSFVPKICIAEKVRCGNERNLFVVDMFLMDSYRQLVIKIGDDDKGDLSHL